MKKIRILGLNYDIYHSPEEINGGMLDAARNHIAEQVILVNPRFNKQSQESGILHEVIEALNYHLQLNLEHDKIMLLESGLNQVLVDNPEFYERRKKK
jgi:hypothetical protein